MTIVLKAPVRPIPHSRGRKEWGCPLTKSRTPWCYGLCDPVEGKGACGRVAPHALTGRTDRAIRAWMERVAAAG